MPRFTLNGLVQAYNNAYFTGDDDNFWNFLKLPDSLDPFVVGGEILGHSGDLYPYYQAPGAFMQNMERWSNYRKADWQRMIDALTAVYNPIENYDRHEDGIITDAHHKGSKDTRTISEAGSEINEHHKGTKTSTSLEEVDTPRVETQVDGSIVAFDASTPTLANRTVSQPTDGTNTRTADPTKNYITSEDLDATHFDKDVQSFTDRQTTDTNLHEDIDATHFDKDERSFNHYHIHGNIGITKTQDMVLSEIDLRKQSIIDIIVAEFEDKFLIQLY